VQVAGIGDLAGIGDRVNAGGDGCFQLGQAATEPGDDRGTGFVEGRCPAAYGIGRAVRGAVDLMQASLCQGPTIAAG
jgi:hypothetical protein